MIRCKHQECLISTGLVSGVESTQHTAISVCVWRPTHLPVGVPYEMYTIGIAAGRRFQTLWAVCEQWQDSVAGYRPFPQFGAHSIW